MNPYRISRNIYLMLCECVNDCAELKEIETTDKTVLENDRAGIRVSLWSSRFGYEIVCEMPTCSVMLSVTPLDASKATVIFSGDCRQQEAWLRVYSYVLGCEGYKSDDFDPIKRILINSYGRELFD
jgi:hypothetical protein